MEVSSNAYVFNDPLHLCICERKEHEMSVNRTRNNTNDTLQWEFKINLYQISKIMSLTCLCLYTEPNSWIVLTANQLHDEST